jgi:hypothetical protein
MNPIVVFVDQKTTNQAIEERDTTMRRLLPKLYHQTHRRATTAARSLWIGVDPRRRPSTAAAVATGCRIRRQDDDIPFPVVGGGDDPWRSQRQWSSSSSPPPTAITGDDDHDSGGLAPTAATMTDETTPATTATSIETTRTALSNQEDDPAPANDDDDKGLRIKVHLPNDGRDWQVPGVETGGRKLAAVFTCKVCNTRSMKQFTEQAYQSGVVIVRCPGCQNRHVLADRLGYFDDTDIDLERIARDNGESLTTVTSMGDDATDATTELDLAKLLGQDKMNELLEKARQKGNDDNNDR